MNEETQRVILGNNSLDTMANQDQKNAAVLNIISQWRAVVNPISDVNSESLATLDLSLEGWNYLRPQMTKDLYYSPFVHACLHWGMNYYHVLEMVYCCVFTPSPTGWCEGIAMAMARSVDSPNSNFVFHYIDCMREMYGSVSGGGHRRRQVSHQRTAIRKNILRSLNNLLLLIRRANENDDTPSLIDAFSASVSDGGLFLAGPLVSQEIIHVLTKIGIITNDVHASNVQVARGTNTCKRLAKLGIKTEEERTNMMSYLSLHLNLSHGIIENALCESLRMRYARNGGSFYDSVRGDYYIYTWDDDGNLRAFAVDGSEVDMTIPEWQAADITSFAGVRWWLPTFEENTANTMRGSILLTNKHA